MSARAQPAEPLWFELTSDQRALLGPLRDYLRSEVAPGAIERDRSGNFPHDIVRTLGGMGVFGRWNVGCWCADTQALRHDIGL